MAREVAGSDGGQSVLAVFPESRVGAGPASNMNSDGSHAEKNANAVS